MATATTKRYGADSWYRALHLWVERQLGKPNKCVECGSTESKRYHWANISGAYHKELSDWRRLCVRCHFLEKNPTHCARGHKRSPENTYVGPSDGFRICLECKRFHRRNRYKLKGV